MKVSSRSKAVALLLLVSCQYSFAALDVALCSSALCYPKVTGQKWGDVKKSCPEGYKLGKDLLGKAVCTKQVPLDCPPGTNLKDGKCCAALTVKDCSDQVDGKCPEGTTESKSCDMGHPLLGHGRKLQSGNPVFKDVNIVGTSYIPNVILPKPAISFNYAPAKPREQPKINIPSMQMPQIILPEPPITFTMPAMPKVGPQIKFEGHPNIIPQIIPILPEPPVTITMPKDAIPQPPRINTSFTPKTVTFDLSKVGPKHTVEVNLPAMPDIIAQATKIPDIDVKLPEGPKVIDLSSLGPKTALDVKLPDVKLPKQGSLTIVNNGANVPQYIDLTGLGPKNLPQVNVVLPSVKTDGSTLNVILEEDKNMPAEFKFPGHGGQKSTIINVPDFKETPERKAKLTVDIQGNPAINKAIEKLNAKKHDVTRINVTMPDIDLSKTLPGGPDVRVDIQPLFTMNKTKHFSTEMPKPAAPAKTIDIKMKDIEIKKIVDDATVRIRPLPISGVANFVHKVLSKKDVQPAGETTQTVINLPDSVLPHLPVPKGKTDVDVSVPLNFGLVKGGSDMVVNVKYQDEWVGGNKTLPNPGAAVANAIGKAVNAVTAASCPTKCCKESVVDKCLPQAFKTETVPAKVGCEKGCTYDLKADKCLCAAGTVSECPSGMAKCSINGKGVCAPDLPHDNKFGLDACLAFKAVCSKAGLLLAKTCAGKE